MNHYLKSLMYKNPDAIAYISGSPEYPSIRGTAKFFGTQNGVLVLSEVYGLPFDKSNPFRIFAYHIHEGGKCAGNQEDPFADALTHFNPTDKPHPYHAGDLPPLFGNYGFALGAVFTARFNINQILGRTIIIHDKPDDFTTQPSGDSGTKIACGVIGRV